MISPPVDLNIVHENESEESNMDVLNLVVNVLHLLVDVIAFVAHATWVISRDAPKAKHYSDDRK